MKAWASAARRLLVFYLSALVLIANAQVTQSQTATARPEFEVATIKPANMDTPGGGIRPLPGGESYTAQKVPVKLIIMLMFHLTTNQISGGPTWMNTERWDIEAKADHPATVDELHVMFQNLLIDRFNLKFHHETKEMPVYALSVDKSGSKLKPNNSPEPFEIPIQGAGRGKLAATHCSIAYLTWFFSNLPWIGRPVLDKTGLAGFYDFTFEFTPPPPVSVPGQSDQDAAPGGDGPSFFTALREQLGLRLEAQRGPVEVMVIDNIEKPTEN